MRKHGTALLATCLAVLALGAGVAQAASFAAEEYPATVIGEQFGAASTGGGGEGAGGTVLGFESSLMLECGSAGFLGSLGKASTSLEVAFGPTGCVAFGFLGASVNYNGCTFRFNAGTGSKDAFTGTIDILCPAGAKIAIVGGTCEVQIGAQTGLGPIGYANLTTELPKPQVRVTFSATGGGGFTYTKTKDGAFCPLNGTGVKTGGALVGATTMKAANPETSAAYSLKVE